MKLSKSQFRGELNKPIGRKYNLIFIGMSGSGKTYWSKKLSKKYSYKHVEFDELIGNSKELANLIEDFPGRDKAEKMGNYFGMPWNNGYKEKEKKFLEIERKFMSKKFPNGRILDLTGSAIYHPKQMSKLSKTGLVVYLETSKEIQKEMLKIYISDPKPVCWNNIFRKKKMENNEEALARCYPLLLKCRDRLYGKYADVRLQYHSHKNTSSIGKFIGEISKELKLQK